MTPEAAMDLLEEVCGSSREAQTVVRVLRENPDMLQALGLRSPGDGRQVLIAVAQRLRREQKWHTERGNFVKASQALAGLAQEIENQLARSSNG